MTVVEPHEYLSTACVHGLKEGLVERGSEVSVAFHERCRRECKFCAAPCECPCHDPDGGLEVVGLEVVGLEVAVEVIDDDGGEAA